MRRTVVFLFAVVVVGGVVQLMDGYGGQDEQLKEFVNEQLAAINTKIDSLATQSQGISLLRREVAEQAFAMEERVTRGLGEERKMREKALETLEGRMASRSLVARVESEAVNLERFARKTFEELGAEKSERESSIAQVSAKIERLANETVSARAEDAKREREREREVDDRLEKHLEAMTFAVGNWTSEFDARCSQAIFNVSETLANDREVTDRSLRTQELLLEETISGLEAAVSASLASCQDLVGKSEVAIRAEVLQFSEKAMERLDEKFRTSNAVLNATALGFGNAIEAVLEKACSSRR